MKNKNKRIIELCGINVIISLWGGGGHASFPATHILSGSGLKSQKEKKEEIYIAMGRVGLALRPGIYGSSAPSTGSLVYSLLLASISFSCPLAIPGVILTHGNMRCLPRLFIKFIASVCSLNGQRFFSLVNERTRRPTRD